MDESTEQGVNSELVIGTKTPVLIGVILTFLGWMGAICLLPATIRNFHRKPWSSEDVETKAKNGKCVLYSRNFGTCRCDGLLCGRYDSGGGICL